MKIMILLLGHTILSYSLNCFGKIWQCAVVFVILAFLTNFIALVYSPRKAAKIVSLSTLSSLILSWGKIYFIHGQPIFGLFFASYLAILVSCTSCAFVFSFLKEDRGFSVSSSCFFAISFAALLDGLVMAGFFIHLYPVSRVVDIFVQEVGLKSLYTGVIYVVLRGVIALPKAHALLKQTYFSRYSR